MAIEFRDVTQLEPLEALEDGDYLVVVRDGGIYMPLQAIIQKDDNSGELLGITFTCSSFQASVSNSAGK